MKILLTGKPGVGKSTILQKVKEEFDGIIYGIISRELRDENGIRVGFEAVSKDGRSKVFAHKKDITSEFVVGGKYFVDLKAVDGFVVPEIEKGLKDENCLVFIDEIGRMQAFSEKFLHTVLDLLESKTNILATIVYDPETWSIEFKDHPNVVLVNVNESNRDLLPEILSVVFNNISYSDKLSRDQTNLVNSLAKEYFAESKYIQIKKLFNNAIPYVVENKVKEISKSGYEVSGNHNSHKLIKSDTGEYSCDCDLFNGRNKYKGDSGECSHIQAIKLYKLAN